MTDRQVLNTQIFLDGLLLSNIYEYIDGKVEGFHYFVGLLYHCKKRTFNPYIGSYILIP